ncbi:MAG: UbiA family prenyltransferase [Proteobacteria bacterium]|nr:UbiA family prenyltransferase [Pseudomonadota bacterium]
MRQPATSRFRGRHRLARGALALFGSIRYDEVLVLQGAPLLGFLWAAGTLDAHVLVAAVRFVVASTALVAHVFVFNDWAGIDGDLRDPRRARRTFRARGIERADAGVAAVVLLAIALALFAWIGAQALACAAGIAVLSGLYSAPGLHWKGMPVAASVLHLMGGTLHFLLGYVSFSPLARAACVIAPFFGLVFAAGHLMHEMRDYDADRGNGIRTSAVAFGPRRAFVAGCALFALAYAWLAGLAIAGYVPRVLAFTPLLGLVHAAAAVRAWRAGFARPSLLALQRVYRYVYLAIGVLMGIAAFAR